MKKLLFFCMVIACFLSCNKEEIARNNIYFTETSKQGATPSLLDFNTFISFGQEHNAYLTEVYQNFTETGAASSLKSAQSEVTNFLISHTN